MDRAALIVRLRRMSGGLRFGYDEDSKALGQAADLLSEDPDSSRRGVDPASFFPVCDVCGERVVPGRVGVWHEVTGFAQIRQGGGAHAVAERKDTGRYRCDPCMRAKRLGIDEQQGALL